MPRLSQVPRAEAAPNVVKYYDLLFGDRDPVAEPGTATGTPGDWWTVFALSPDVFKHATDGFTLYRTRQLSPALRELGQTRAGWARGSQFVFSQHCKASRSAGLTEEQIQAIPSWEVADCFSPVERAVLAYTDALVLNGGRCSDGVFEALRAHLTEVEILELTYVTCLYDLHATMCRALHLEFDDRADPIVEVPGPGERMSLDIGAATSLPKSE